MRTSGIFTISLDFEMMWGCHDWTTCEEYGESNIRQVPEVIDRLLSLLECYEAKATIAIVGMLYFANKNELINHIPEILPKYLNKNLSPYKCGYIEQICSSEQSLYFAPYIIEKLKKHPLIEIASHTFSHYFCWAPGQSRIEFEEDLKKAIETAKEKGITLDSIIFPRNEVATDYLNICRKFGIRSYRGNPPKYFNHPSNKLASYRQRLFRFLDTYNLYASPSITPIGQLNFSSLPINIPASRFLRPYNSKLSLLEGLKIKRICSEMEAAAQRGCLYHLWWHPHNMGANMDENFKGLTKILACYHHLNCKYGMKSLTMREVSAIK